MDEVAIRLPRGRVLPRALGVTRAAIAFLVLLVTATGCGVSGPDLASYVWKPIPLPTGLKTEDPVQRGSFGFTANKLWQHQAAWTGQEMFVFGSGGTARYNPSTDTWAPVSLAGAPKASAGSLLVWTGKEVLVWSGGSGGRYDPVKDSWKPMSTTSAPGALYDGRAIWTGKEMIVGEGGTVWRAYNPLTDSWRSLGAKGAPVWLYGLFGSSVVWTGKEMIVWGGLYNNIYGSAPARYVQDGAAYDPDTDSWSVISSAGAPTPRQDPVAVWTGKEMLVIGGMVNRTNPNELYSDAIYADDGGRYDPSTDTWSPIPATRLLPTYAYLLQANAIWTGQEAIIWGGYWSSKNEATVTGERYQLVQARYDPRSSTWSPLANEGAPIIPVFDPLSRAVVWDGKEMLVFGAVRLPESDSNTLYYTYRGARFGPPGGPS